MWSFFKAARSGLARSFLMSRPAWSTASKYSTCQSAMRINKIVEKCHVGAGLPALGVATGVYPRHYRHVALSILHFVGCAAQAKNYSFHTADSKVFKDAYRVQLVDVEFTTVYSTSTESTSAGACNTFGGRMPVAFRQRLNRIRLQLDDCRRSTIPSLTL